MALREPAQMLRRVEITSASSGRSGPLIPIKRYPKKLADHDEDRLNGNVVPEDRLPKQGHNPSPSFGSHCSPSDFRRPFMRIAAYIGVVVILFASYALFNGGFGGGTLVDKAERDEIARVEKDDPDMATAF